MTSPIPVSTTYIYHGIGYEAAADAVIDFTDEDLKRSISKFRPAISERMLDEPN